MAPRLPPLLRAAFLLCASSGLSAHPIQTVDLARRGGLSLGLTDDDHYDNATSDQGLLNWFKDQLMSTLVDLNQSSGPFAGSFDGPAISTFSYDEPEGQAVLKASRFDSVGGLANLIRVRREDGMKTKTVKFDRPSYVPAGIEIAFADAEPSSDYYGGLPQKILQATQPLERPPPPTPNPIQNLMQQLMRARVRRNQNHSRSKRSVKSYQDYLKQSSDSKRTWKSVLRDVLAAGETSRHPNDSSEARVVLFEKPEGKMISNEAAKDTNIQSDDRKIRFVSVLNPQEQGGARDAAIFGIPGFAIGFGRSLSGPEEVGLIDGRPGSPGQTVTILERISADNFEGLISNDYLYETTTEVPSEVLAERGLGFQL